MPTALWGGILVTVVVATIGIVFSLPLGVLLALGRRSELPVVGWAAVTFIEFVRGVPVITVLFMASVMLPLFVPERFAPDKLVRALIGVALFASAYMAEVVRGGLAAVPRGQYEAARALGLSYWRMMGLVILPQALRVTLPNIVNTFIGLFKDTTLVFVVGIFDFLRTIEAARADPKWAAPNMTATGYAFAALFYFVCCYGMSRYARRVEARLAACRAAIRDCDGRARGPGKCASPPSEVAVEVVGLHKWYGEFHVLRDINLKVARGERIVICGPSGGGKSTLLRCVNRLEDWQRGRIVVDGVELTEDPKRILAVRRDVGMVFQHFNLFPHLTVLENCTLAPIWVRHMPKRDAEALAMNLSRARENTGSGRQVPGASVGRSAATRGDRPRAVHESQHHAVRRADVGARSGNGEGGARHHGRAGERRHHHARGFPRDGFCAAGRRSCDPHGRRTDRRSQRAEEFLRQPATRADAALSQSNPLLKRQVVARWSYRRIAADFVE